MIAQHSKSNIGSNRNEQPRWRILLKVVIIKLAITGLLGWATWQTMEKTVGIGLYFYVGIVVPIWVFFWPKKR